MNIWVIGRNYPQPSNGMQGAFELEQAKLLGKQYEKVAYLSCSLRPLNSFKGKQDQVWEEDGISIYSYSAFFFPRIYPLYAIPIRNHIWRKILQKVQENTGRPDVIHVHYPAMLMLGEVLSDYHESGTKIFITEHWSKVLTRSLDRIEKKHYKKYFEYVDECICVGKSLTDSINTIVDKSNTHISVIPNIVNQEFTPLHSKHLGFEFIAVGRLVKIKQFDKIIITFAKCFRGKEVKLKIIGDGEEYKRLKKLIFHLKMERQIILTGYLDKKKVAQHLADADCLICFSKYETFGVPIVEAWASGIPTIVTTTAAVVSDYFDKRLGIKVIPNDMEGLARAMIYMYLHIDHYDRKFLSTFAKERFSKESVNKKLIDLYQRYK